MSVSISNPIMLSARSPSLASTTSNSSSTSNTSSASDLSETARTILNSLCNERDFTSVQSYVSPDVIIQHDDNDPISSRDAFIKEWQAALIRMPNYKMDIKEACVDETQLKVWVRSEITGLPGGVRKESIDMMQFNADGMLTSSCDCQRVMRRGRHGDEGYDDEQ